MKWLKNRRWTTLYTGRWTACWGKGGEAANGEWGGDWVGESLRLRLWGAKWLRISVAAAVLPKKTPTWMILSNKKGGKLVPDIQFKCFTRYHHLKVCKLPDSVVEMGMGVGNKRNQTKGGWWSSKMLSVSKDNIASENNVGWKFIKKPHSQGATR
jgi:hypothetical protein